MKFCPGCQQTKPLSEFSKRPERPSGVRSRCKACLAVQSKKYREVDPERWLAIKQRHRETHREQAKAYSKEYREKHPEQRKAYNKKYRTENAEFVKFAMRRWQKRNPDRVRELQAKRRAQKLDAWVEDVDRQTVYERDRGICHICHRRVSRKRFELDHLVPLARGGEHSYRNVSIAHHSCNLSRGPGRKDAQLLLIG